MVLNKILKIPSTFEVLKTIVSKGEFDKKSPLQKWSFLYGIGRSCLKILQFKIYEEDQTLNLFSYVSAMYSFLYMILVVYTAIYYMSHNQYLTWLPCTCLFVGPIFGSMPLMRSVLTKERVVVQRFLAFPGKHIYPETEDDEDAEYYEICSQHINASIKSFVVKMAMIFTSVVIALIWPTYLLLSQGIKTTATQVKFPFIDENSDAEFIGNFIFQTIVGGHGFIGYIGLEVGMNICTDLISVTQNLLEYRLKMLDVQREKEPLIDSQPLFMSVIRQIRTYNKFAICLRDLFYFRLLLTPAGYTYAIAMAIFCQFAMGYAAGYGLAAMLWVQLFYVCEMGEHTDSNRLSDTLYKSSWYALSVKHQKDLMQMIRGCQNGAKLRFGPFSIINRWLFKEITNKIFSYIMFLLNFSS